jgi:hypothetical protein
MSLGPAGRLAYLIQDEELPAWRSDRGMTGAPFRFIAALDDDIARSVLKALDRGHVDSSGRGSFTLGGAGGRAAIFWHGAKAVTPRKVLFA